MTAFDLVAHLRRQIDFSARTFGPGDRRSGIADHIVKELREVAGEPIGAALPEWIDIILLGFDGAWRDGHSAEVIAITLGEILARNEGRSWPDWRTQDLSKAIEHIRPAATPCMTAVTHPRIKSWIAAIGGSADYLADVLVSGRCDKIAYEAAYLNSLCRQVIQYATDNGGSLPPPPCAGLDVKGFGRRLSVALDRGDFSEVADIADELEAWGS